MAILDFNVADAEEISFGLLPAGRYAVQILSAEVKPTKNNNGEIISVRFAVTEEDNFNHNIYAGFNTKNQNVKAENIGRAQFRSLCKAVGMLNLTETNSLIGSRLLVDVVIKPAEGIYEAKNEIKKYSALGEDASQKPPHSAPIIESVAPAKKQPAWAKK